MKVILNNSRLIFKSYKEQTVIELNDIVVRDSYWDSSNLTIGSATTYDRSSTRIKIRPSSICSVILNEVNSGYVFGISLIEIDSSNNVVSDKNFNTSDMYSGTGAHITLTDKTVEVILNIQKADGYTVNYYNSLFKYHAAE